MATGDDLYAWQVQEPDGRWSMVAAIVGESAIPLIHRSQEIMSACKPLATKHAEALGQRLRFAHFTLEEVINDEL